MSPGRVFGELAILYNCTRTASVKGQHFIRFMFIIAFCNCFKCFCIILCLMCSFASSCLLFQSNFCVFFMIVVPWGGCDPSGYEKNSPDTAFSLVIVSVINFLLWIFMLYFSAITLCKLWTIERNVFQGIVMKTELMRQKQHIELLKGSVTKNFSSVLL